MVEICYLDVTIIIPKNVWSLYVAVHDLLFDMQVFEAFCDLLEDALDLCWLQLKSRTIVGKLKQVVTSSLHFDVHAEFLLILGIRSREIAGI